MIGKTQKDLEDGEKIHIPDVDTNVYQDGEKIGQCTVEEVEDEKDDDDGGPKEDAYHEYTGH